MGQRSVDARQARRGRIRGDGMGGKECTVGKENKRGESSAIREVSY
jgi:hypothetical protein